MKKHRLGILLAAFLCCLAVGGIALAQSSAHYGLTWNLLSGGGGTAQSPHYIVSSSLGQSAASPSASSHYRAGSGFWYAYGVPQQVTYKIFMPIIANKN